MQTYLLITVLAIVLVEFLFYREVKTTIFASVLEEYRDGNYWYPTFVYLTFLFLGILALIPVIIAIIFDYKDSK